MEQNQVIKNLLFDLGGGIIDLKRENCVAALTAIGMRNADEMLGQYVQTGEFLDLERGAITSEEFHKALRKHFTREVTDSQIDEAFFKFLIGIPAHRLTALRNLRPKYRIYMLSNTNPIMFEHKIREFFQAEGLEMENYFDGIVVSYKAKAVKPDRKIFDYAVETLKIKPEETLFFDDSQSNLDSAAKLGFATYLVKPGTEFTDYFSRPNK